MAGRKLFTNKTDKEIYINIVLRRGLNPSDDASMRGVVVLQPYESSWRTYGDKDDVLINSFRIHFIPERGGPVESYYKVTERGSEIDDRLNRYNAIDINYENGAPSFSSWQKNE